MFDFIKNKPLTFISGIYLIFSWVMFVLRMRFGLPPFSMSIAFGILFLAMLGDATGLSRLNLGGIFSGNESSPEATLFLMIIVAIFAIHTIEKIAKAIHEYIEERNYEDI